MAYKHFILFESLSHNNTIPPYLTYSHQRAYLLGKVPLSHKSGELFSGYVHRSIWGSWLMENAVSEIKCAAFKAHPIRLFRTRNWNSAGRNIHG